MIRRMKEKMVDHVKLESDRIKAESANRKSTAKESASRARTVSNESIADATDNVKEGNESADDCSHETTYCICRLPASGSMIACDNPKCDIEWFHFACLGIKDEPETWFCPLCRDKQ
mmetsp:Transcript_13788/g.20487  ORF Transcript_13788/g.20487 Transcript_13788/m.20487 type:complete len:117 (+) Transcript_13788:354-704(+)